MSVFQILNTVVTTLKSILLLLSVSGNMHSLLLLDPPQRAWSSFPDLNP